MRYNFDEEIDRRNTYSEKWDYQGGDYIPVWVADMDFRSPEIILDAVRDRLEHGVFGYTDYDWELDSVVVDYYRKYYGIDIDAKWIVYVPSVMPGSNIACRVADGKILYNTPMYPHIRRLHNEAHCPYQEIPLAEKDNVYTIDFDRMESQIEQDVKAYILCNPHNPVGRVFTESELLHVADFCKTHDLLLISDEIHSQLIYEGTHIPAFSINEWAMEHNITLMSVAKTYNIPAMPFAFAIIPNDELREKYRSISSGLFSVANALTLKAVKTALTECDDWREELLEYLKKNRDILERRISGISGMSVVHNQATYLAWIDARGLDVPDPWLFFREKAGVNFSNGADFGNPGFLRINFGCTTRTLEEVLDRVEMAVSGGDR